VVVLILTASYRIRVGMGDVSLGPDSVGLATGLTYKRWLTNDLIPMSVDPGRHCNGGLQFFSHLAMDTDCWDHTTQGNLVLLIRARKLLGRSLSRNQDWSRVLSQS